LTATRHLGPGSYRWIDQKSDGKNDDAQHERSSGSLSLDCGVVSAAGTIGTAVTLILFDIASNATTALLASIIAGFSWIIVLSALNVSAQVALPEWVRGRGLSLYVTVLFGSAPGRRHGATGRRRGARRVRFRLIPGIW
jgi:hypothetical protein